LQGQLTSREATGESRKLWKEVSKRSNSISEVRLLTSSEFATAMNMDEDLVGRPSALVEIHMSGNATYRDLIDISRLAGERTNGSSNSTNDESPPSAKAHTNGKD
jgi:hypothetical protein